MNDVRSYSQLNSYTRCPYMYYLERVEMVWQRPAAWLPMGSAVHEAAEAWELSGRTMTLEAAVLVFENAYQRETNNYLAETPNPRFWFASGPYKGAEDIARRFKLGREHVARYIAWYEKHPDEVPITLTAGPDTGKMLVEFPFEIEIGGIPVRGFIDWIGYDSDGALIVRDNKTGTTPGGPDQLATYALAVQASVGAVVNRGDFFMTRTGKPTFPYQLTQVVKTELEMDYVRMDTAVKAGSFPAKPEAKKCMFCSVSASCKYRV